MLPQRFSNETTFSNLEAGTSRARSRRGSSLTLGKNMNRFILLLAVLITTRAAALADSPGRPYPFITVSLRGDCYFKMVPRSTGERADIWRRPDGVGIAYRLRPDGSEEELWRTQGWYSFEVFLSPDGKHLVAMGPWNVGSEPKKGDLAVAFYAYGKLLKAYSTADLVKDKSKVLASVSHYMWLARDLERNPDVKKDPAAELRVPWFNTFNLKTCDGITYEFDMTTGAIQRTEGLTRR